MSAHTPGPWSWIDGDGNEGTLSAPSGKVIDSAPYEGMFFSSDGDITANRALIAAAPQLLESLINLRECILCWHEEFPEGIGNNEQGFLDAAAIAINCAKGNQE